MRPTAMETTTPSMVLRNTNGAAPGRPAWFHGRMDRARLLALLASVRAGDVGVDDAAAALAHLSPASLPGADGAPVAVVDHHRALRCGFPEVVYGPGKTPDDLVRIAREILARGDRLLVTRCEGPACAALLAAVPDAVHHPRARAVTVTRGGTTSG